MAQQTDKFDPAGSSTSSQRSNTLTPTVNLKGPDGKIKNNVPLDNTRQVRISNTLTCFDVGQQTIGATFSGDGTNKPASSNFNLQVGNQLSGNLGFVKQIVAGPGIYISNPNGDGVVSISLSPFRDFQTENEDLYHISYTISDLENVNATDQSMFLASGGRLGVATGIGIAVRSRDGVNWIDINNTNLAAVALNPSMNLQSSTFPGSGQVYIATNANVNNQTLLLQSINMYFGIEGKTETNGCGWCSDDFTTTGSFLKLGGQNIPAADESLFCFYNTGSLITNSLFLMGTVTRGDYGSDTGAIYRFLDFPANLEPASANVPIAMALELEVTNSAFRQAHSNLETANFSSYQIIYADYGLGKLWKSNRSGKSAGTWTNVLTSAVPLYGIQYGGGVWVSCGDADTIYTSTNGTTWTKRSTKLQGSNWRWCTYGNGIFVVVGENGRAAFSEDGGITWQIAQTGTTNNLYCMAFSPSLCRFVAVGAKRTIISVKV